MSDYPLISEDLEKLKKQWNAVQKYCDANYWSPAITRAVTAAELTITIIIKLEKNIGSSVKYTGGLSNNISKNLIPLLKNDPDKLKKVKDLRKRLKRAIKIRNQVVHDASFASENDLETFEVISTIKECIYLFLELYDVDIIF